MTKETFDAVLQKDPHVVICKNEREAYAVFDVLTACRYLWRSGSVLEDVFASSIQPDWNDDRVFALFVYPREKACSYLLDSPTAVTQYAENNNPPMPVVWVSGAETDMPAVSDSDIMALFGGDSV